MTSRDAIAHLHETVQKQLAADTEAARQQSTVQADLKQYRKLLDACANFVGDGSTIGKTGAAAFMAAQQALLDQYADGWLQSWRLDAAEQADPCESIAIELYLLACQGDEPAIATTIQQAYDSKYLMRLRKAIEAIADRLHQRATTSELPWTRVFQSRGAFVRAMDGLERLTDATIKRRLGKGDLLERGDTGKQYRSADTIEQRKILEKIRSLDG